MKSCLDEVLLDMMGIIKNAQGAPIQPMRDFLTEAITNLEAAKEALSSDVLLDNSTQIGNITRIIEELKEKQRQLRATNAIKFGPGTTY